MRKDELQFEHTGSPSITREESWNKGSYPSVLKGYSLSTRQELLARERVKRKDEKGMINGIPNIMSGFTAVRRKGAKNR